MPPEEINIAIDAHLGTELFFLKKQGMYYRPSAAGYTQELSLAGRFTREEAESRKYTPAGAPGEWVTMHPVPPLDFCRDLNAMHEAEKAVFFGKGIPASRWETYDNHLHDITGGFGRAHATASQRAEAFLRAIGKWVESKQEAAA